MSEQGIPDAWQRRIGAAEPATMLGYALHWARRGLHVFPCEQFLGDPLIAHWHKHATTDEETIIEWWSEHPDADIGAVPGKSGQWATIAAGRKGRITFSLLEENLGEITPTLYYMDRWDNYHLWFKSEPLPPSHRLGPGLVIVGEGDYLYLAPSVAPARLGAGVYK
jgi:hypothetical protein